jgi:putative intracellular protease/amidase
VSEAAHPWKQFTEAGCAVDFVSPKGGVNPFDGFDETDPVQTDFMTAFPNGGPFTLTPERIDPSAYEAIFYVGGHGTMWDFPDNVVLARIAANIYEAGGVLGAVCHGPAGLINITLSDGTFLVAGKHLSAFTDEEEAAVGLANDVPFLLASTLVARGAIHEPVENFQPQLVVDGRLVTGQNPASVIGVATAMVGLILNGSQTTPHA